MRNKFHKGLILAAVLMIALIGCDTREPTPPDPTVVSYNLNLTADRYTIYADNGKTVAKITAILTNDVGEPQQGANVVFSALSGAIASNIATNSSGQAVATFDDKGQAVNDLPIVARYSDGSGNTVRDTVYIDVLPMEALVSSFFATTSPRSGQVTVFTDDSTYTATINANVRDSLGVAVRNVGVNYRVLSGMDIGYLDVATDSTDALGTSQAVFTNNEGQIGTIIVEASVSVSSLETAMANNPGAYHFGSMLKSANAGAAAFADTVTLDYVSGEAYHLSLQTLDNAIYADNGASVSRIYAVVKDGQDEGIDSIKVRFSANIGTIESPKFTSSNGVAETIFSDLGATVVGSVTARIIATVLHPFYGEIKDTIYVEIRENDFEPPKVPEFINMTASFDELPPVGMPDTTISRLSLFVSDSNGFAVDAGTEVTFDTDIGFVTPFTLTDENGNASAIFTMGDSSGIAKVYAYSGIAKDSVLIRVRPTGASYIVIAPANPNYIVVQGGWGQESTTIYAEVRDARGELVDVDYDVTFQIGPAPAGANLNGVGNVVVSETNYGVASATLNAGTGAGPVQVTVSTTTLAGNVIRSTGTPITIRAGLPAEMNADLSFQDLEPIGGGLYEIEVAAVLWDQYTNPVEDSTQVYWSLDPPNVCDIIGESYTNNENRSGDAYHGVAWTKLYYNSRVSFTPMRIIAQTWGADGDTIMAFVNEDVDSLELMPFWPGELTIFPSIGFWDFQPADAPDPALVPVVLTAQLMDYYSRPINNGRILFQSIGAQSFDPLDPDTGMPIVRTNSQGIAQITAFFPAELCTPNFNTDGTVNSYNPFTAFVWCTLLDPMSVTSEQQSIEFRRSIQP